MGVLPRVAVIGAGSSGITALKALVAAGFEPVGFELGDRVGGNWVFQNSNGMSSAYSSLHINTSRERMAYSDFPMPASFPDFPHHSHIAAYFDDYVEHFGLRRHIRFQTGVQRAARHPDGGFTLTLDDGSQEDFDALLVANGHHWDARWPTPPFPGSDTFAGEQVHSHEIKDNKPFAGRRVLIVGMGNSAMDIAVESSWVAERTLLSARRGTHVIPKYLFGKPLDQVSVGVAARLPWKARQKLMESMLRLAVGRYSAYGLPEPEQGLFQAHPTISDTILSRIAHGEVTPKPNIAALDGDRVRFTDGSVEQVDIVVYATGYHVTFPFFDPGFLAAPDNQLPLFQRVFHPDVPDVFFLGLLQPLGAIMPIAELQGRVVADYLRGRYVLPTVPTMRTAVTAEQQAMQRRYVASSRHTMQVDYDVYMHGLAREWEQGRRRAAKAGYPLAVPARRIRTGSAG